MDPVITLKHVGKTFKMPDTGELFPAVRHINFEIGAGEFFVIVGPSGSGKSTLLRVMSGLEKQYDGAVEFDPAISKTDISFVFQHFAIFPWLTVFQNVELPLIARRVPKKIREEKVKNELRILRLEQAARAYPRELSGGMRQRVGIARALVTDPRVMFLDEPFSELDSFTAGELRKELLNVWRERGMTVVMVTHIIEEAIELAGRIAVMTAHPGRIEKIFSNQLPRPRLKRSEEFYHLEDEIFKILKP